MATPTIRLSEGRSVGGNNPCFIIAEIGQNHQGNMNTAKKLITVAKDSGADCVKFQKSVLSEKFTPSALARPYSNPHSWGATYGEHKQHIEFSTEQYRELQKYARETEILFSASAMDPVSVNVLHSLEVPFIKIGSGDADNLLLIQSAAKLHRPLFISTGMQDINNVKMIYETVTKVHKQLVLLHCVSAYPTPAECVNLRVIQEYQQLFSDVPIGYSGHELGTTISVAAVALGAKVVERHITLNKGWKGSDHASSLKPDEFRQMVSDIRQVEIALGSPVKQFLECERECYDKLGKSVVAAYDLSIGTKLTENNIKIKVSEPPGVSCKHLYLILGKILINRVQKDCPITYFDIAK